MQGLQGTTLSTPILESGVMPLRIRRIRPQALLLALLSGIVLMEFLAIAGGIWSEHWPAVFLFLCVLGVAVHEVGHLLAGWAMGFHFNSIQIGPLLLEDECGVLRTQFTLDMIYLGYAAMHANTVHRLRRRLLIYIMGGPAANLLSVATIVFISYLLPRSDSGLATATGQFGAISLVLALISLTPIRANDGGLIEMLLSSPFAARRYMSTVALGSQFARGIRARNWKQTWLNAATCIPDKSPSDFYANWMAYLSANDGKDAMRAAIYLERCLSLTPLLSNRLRTLVAREASVYCAWFKEDLSLAEKWLRQVEKQRSVRPWARHESKSPSAVPEVSSTTPPRPVIRH